ncbi:MAG: hypothetical protein LBC61_00240 [Candidatus Peribacteria bacterium]|nr:hypothetical protein [Candidatus Peribacteria bacterium]
MAITQASVNVVISIFSGFIQVFRIIFAVLSQIICVFPVPGQATIITGQ